MLLDQDQTPSRWWAVALAEAKHESAQTVLALLVAKSPNIEIFVMRAQHRNHRVETQQSPPIWILPITEAVANSRMGIAPNTRYERLHTVDLDMRGTYSVYVALLFALPCLREVRLRDIFCLDPDKQPDMPPSPEYSGVDTLLLHSIFVPAKFTRFLIHICKALKLFHFDTKPGIGTRGIDLVNDTVSALQQHRDSLENLSLIDADGFLDKNVVIAPIDGFQRFHALKRLAVPFDMPMGKLPGTHISEQDWPHSREYPHMRDVRPPRLQLLDLEVSYTTVPREYHNGFTSVLTIALPSCPPQYCPAEIQLNYGAAGCRKSIPFNFWDIKHAYLERGIRFNYRIGSLLGWEGELFSRIFGSASYCRFTTASESDPRSDLMSRDEHLIPKIPR
jgi:hypothetical protein